MVFVAKTHCPGVLFSLVAARDARPRSARVARRLVWRGIVCPPTRASVPRSLSWFLSPARVIREKELHDITRERRLGSRPDPPQQAAVLDSFKKKRGFVSYSGSAVPEREIASLAARSRTHCRSTACTHRPWRLGRTFTRDSCVTQQSIFHGGPQRWSQPKFGLIPAIYFVHWMRRV